MYELSTSTMIIKLTESPAILSQIQGQCYSSISLQFTAFEFASYVGNVEKYIYI